MKIMEFAKLSAVVVINPASIGALWRKFPIPTIDFIMLDRFVLGVSSYNQC